MKRSLQIRLVKANAEGTEEEPVEVFGQKVAFTSNSVKEIMWEGMKFVAVYVALDTMRKMFIEMAKK